MILLANVLAQKALKENGVSLRYCICLLIIQEKKSNLIQNYQIDFCANNPCEDGYRCIDNVDEYSCVCPGEIGDGPDCHEVPRTVK